MYDVPIEIIDYSWQKRILYVSLSCPSTDWMAEIDLKKILGTQRKFLEHKENSIVCEIRRVYSVRKGGKEVVVIGSG